MSLIHWWPLNGDTQDRINNIALITNDAIYTNGKISQALQMTNTISKTPNPFINLNDWSFACWIREDDKTILWRDYFCFSKNLLRLELDNASNWRWYCGEVGTGNTYPDTGDLFASGTIVNTGVNNNVWYHVAITKTGAEAKFYLNGILKATTSLAKNFTSESAMLYFNSRATETTNTSMGLNDVRCYDHALSAAEVKELSKALVVHYTFDDELAEPTENILTDSSCLSGHGSSWTVIAETYHGHTIYNNTVTSPGSWNNAGFRVSDGITMKNPNKYSHVTISFWKRLNIKYGLNVTGYITIKYSDDNTQIVYPQYNKSDWANDDNSIGQWEFITATAPIDNTKTMTGISNMYIYNDKAPSGNCDFACIQLEAKDHATPYTPISREGMLYNETGLTQPNSDAIQNIQLVTDAAIGNYSLSCSGNTYITHNPEGDASHGVTVSMWIKYNNDIDGSTWVAFADANSQLGFGSYKSASGTYGVIAANNGTNKRRLTNLVELWKNKQWNHVVVTMDSTNTINQCWINGIEGSYGDSDFWSHDNYLTIGARYLSNEYSRQFNGMIDDFRLYHTQLSPEEIKELYNCGGRISNLGDAFTGEFIEGAERTSVNKNHTITTKEIYEQILPSGYQQLEYIKSTGTQYINTEHYATNNTKIIVDFIDHSVSSSGAWSGLFGGDNYVSGGSVDMAFGLYIVKQRNSYYIYFGQTADAAVALPISPDDHRHTAQLDKTGLYIDHQCLYNNPTPGTKTSRNPIGLFGFKRETISFSSCTIYKCQIYENNVLIRDFIPARNASGVLGLYDMVNNQFYTNAGSGNFIAGPTLTTGQASMLRAGGLTARQIIEI